MPTKKTDQELVHGVVGMYFHIKNDEGFVERQGRVIGKEALNGEDYYIVKYFEWLTGCYIHCGLENVDIFRAKDRVNLYYDSEEMNDWYKYHSPNSRRDNS